MRSPPACVRLRAEARKAHTWLQRLQRRLTRPCACGAREVHVTAHSSTPAAQFFTCCAILARRCCRSSSSSAVKVLFRRFAVCLAPASPTAPSSTPIATVSSSRSIPPPCRDSDMLCMQHGNNPQSFEAGQSLVGKIVTGEERSITGGMPQIAKE